MKKDNPWTKKREAATAKTRLTGRTEHSGSVQKKTIKIPANIRAKRSGVQSAKNASRFSVGKLQSWVHVGSSVRLSWRYDHAYGVGHTSFDGTVTDLDDWITVENSAGVICHMPLSMVTVKRVKSAA